MKIVGMMITGAEADRYLEASLKELKRLCDDAIIATNNADQKTKDLIEKYDFWQYEDNREWGIYQPDIKTDLLRRVAKLNPNWIIALDSDEVFAPEFTREEAERLAETNEIAYYFLVINLYNDTEHYANSIGIQKFWNVRYFKYLSGHNQYQHKRLHCGLAPPIFYHRGWHAPYYLEHYGLMKAEDRQKKVERYAKYDPEAKFKGREYYDDLSKELKSIPFNRAKLIEQLKNSSETKPRNMLPSDRKKQERKFYYLLRLKDGKTIDVPEEQLNDAMKSGEFRLLSEVGETKTQPLLHISEMYEMSDLNNSVEPVPEKPELECPICGKVCKNKLGLLSHKRTHYEKNSKE